MCSILGQDGTPQKLAFMQLVSLLHEKGSESLKYVYEECQMSYKKCFNYKLTTFWLSIGINNIILVQINDDP